MSNGRVLSAAHRTILALFKYQPQRSHVDSDLTLSAILCAAGEKIAFVSYSYSRMPL